MAPKVALNQFRRSRETRRSSSVFSTIKKYEDKDTAGWLPEAREAISQLEHLPDGWDSYGSTAVQQIAVNNAIRFLFGAPSRLVPAPHVSPTPGGGIGLHWQVNGRDLELEFTTTGTIESLKSYVGGKSEPEEKVIQDTEAYALLRWLAGIS